MKTITNLAVSNVKKNRTRSILIVISILLTTMLLALIATIGTGILRSGKANAGKLYGNYDGTYSRVNTEQLQKMELRSEFTNIGKQSYVAMVENSEADMSLYWADEQTQENVNITEQLKTGNMPQKGNEIAAPKEFFQKLGIDDPKPGDTVEVSYRTDMSSKYQTETFTISGILATSESSSLQSAYNAYISQECFEQLVPEQQRSFTVSFRLSDSVDITADSGEEVLKELAEKCGIDSENVSENYIYLMYTREPGTETIAACIMIALLVIVVSVVVIYNIFQVGIVQKIQEYGKIKALGTTRKQMKSMIFREGMMLAAVGVPLGLLLGLGAGKIIFYCLENQQMENLVGGQFVRVSVVSLPILLLVVLAAVLTVWLALKKPMKIVSSISPVEAVHYQENMKKRNSIRKGKEKLSVWGMTMANLSANRRRTVATICTMGLSCVLFVALSNFAGNIDNEYETRKAVAYGRFFLELDYSLNDEAYPENNLESIRKENPLGEELQEKIKQIDGVTNVITRNIIAVKEEKRGASEPSSVVVFDKGTWEKYAAEEACIGALDYDSAVRENGIAYTWSYFMEENGYEPGQTIELELLDGDRTVPYTGKLQGSFENVETDWVITEDTWKSLGLTETTTGDIWVDCKEKDTQRVEAALRELLTGVEHVELITYENTMKQTEMGTRMMQGGIYGLIAILGCIGFLNMANTIITGVVTRKRELGILQAVGMTNRQLNWMLQLEGVIFSAGTVLVSLLIGCPLGYALFSYGKKKSIYGLNEYHFPWLEIGVMVAIIVVMQGVLSFLLSRNARKETLVERINYQG